ncbi:DNA polymerase III, delta' subunit [Legionella beliardensis]|uniref:DNA-directed DNA polymerase n=1 Tax=Legionella beliardensis TaxID=91822 RepID=A0A378I1Y6_9GAMM|nr:hypothetical protein [Legionella beliardensis]STX28962.1 DNA polymerase III, delta' subunit [Legionella beliardensis]
MSMHKVDLTDLKPEYHGFWQQFKRAYDNQRLTHALLLSGASLAYLKPLVNHMIATMLCKQVTAPCTTCKSCNLAIQGEHPDLHLIEPDKVGGVIKVEQVRELQNYLYTSPQIAENKIVFIKNAEKMNHSAANSLLKILEEPPQNSYFILGAESINTIPATIFSRCQYWFFSNFNHYNGNYLVESSLGDAESSLGKLSEQSESLINDLLAIQKEKISIIAIAEKWSIYELMDLARFMYLVTAQMIHNYFHKNYPQSVLFSMLEELTKYFKPINLFFLLDKLNQIIKNLSYSINVNQLLALEDLLLSFYETREFK